MPRIIIHPKDVSALGLIAQRPSRHQALAKKLSKDAREIAYVLGGRTPRRAASSRSRNIVKTAEYLSKWAGDAPKFTVNRAVPVKSWIAGRNGPTAARAKAPAKKKAAKKKARK